ncbi:hypothetical protein MTR67_026459 [Solanum verrucosum]|uniref:Retrotransposon gag domain-containing protein n=1 Tax=Solanum verrucosum TaxID=315347 RepID=A0AAF0QYZ4_SOLVR|nr:hypothetical protein MTR67_026459 [Solanum verrucosum]
MNPSEFLGSKIDEDPQNFIDEIKKIFRVVQVTRNNRVELASYQLKDVDHKWFTKWIDNMGADAAPVVTWECFTRAFLDRFVTPHIRKGEKCRFLEVQMPSTEPPMERRLTHGP